MANLFIPTGSVDFSSLDRGIMRGHAALKAFYPATRPLNVKPFFTNHIIRINGPRKYIVPRGFGSK